MPTIYLKNTTFNKLVESNHYHDYEKVISRGVDLALMEELELRQVPKSDPGPLPEQPQESTSTTTPVDTVTEDLVCPHCQTKITDPAHRKTWKTPKGIIVPYHDDCLMEARPWAKIR